MSYKTKKSAVRAAKKEFGDNYHIVENADGTFDYMQLGNTEPTVDPVPAWAQDENQGDETPALQPIPVEPAPVAANVEVVIPTDVPQSDIVHFIWAFLAANPGLSRKSQIAAMIALAINPNTVKTQTSRYYKHGGDRDAYLAFEKAKRDAEREKIAEMVKEIQARRAAEEAAAAEKEEGENNAA